MTLSLFGPGSARQQRIALTILRVVTGIIFVAHGGQKLFVWGLDGVVGGFTQMGVPMAGLVGPLVALLEFFGGIALILGLLTRLASFGLAFNMLGAMLLVHAPAGFFLPSGIEFTLILLAANAALTLAGAGAFSVDEIIARRRDTVGATSVPGAVEPAQDSRRRRVA
jgi:putative oxidoreductase